MGAFGSNTAHFQRPRNEAEARLHEALRPLVGKLQPPQHQQLRMNGPLGGSVWVAALVKGATILRLEEQKHPCPSSRR